MATPGSMLALALVLLPAAVWAHGGLRGDRRLSSWSQELHHIWGQCDPLNRDMRGCSLGGSAQCSDRLSPGPRDAHVEIRLGSLPASTPQEEVHLQWWAARQSPTVYHPLTSAVNASVYRDLRDAYPKFYDSDFNGGNVRVNETGEAVIRVRAPATYFVYPYIAVPHVHLRICRGSSAVQHGRRSDAFFFGQGTTWVTTGSQEDEIRVLSAVPFAGRVVSDSQRSADAPRPCARIIGIRSRGPRSTTLEATTTTLAPTTTTMDNDMQQVLLEAARETMVNLDALEFSPVYLCLMEGKPYDQISSECVDSCPASTVMVHGQCVREELESPGPVQLRAAWRLTVRCGSHCWGSDARNETLHRIRLSLAGHLDLPFQEVTQVGLGFPAASQRRLLDTVTGYLKLTVSTKRVSAASGADLLVAFLPDAPIATELFGMDVQGVELLSGEPAETVHSTELVSIGEGTDPYTPAYDHLDLRSGGSGPLDSSALGLLPPAAIAGIAVAVVVLGAAFVGLVWRQRRLRARSQAAQAKQAQFEANQAELDGEPVKAPAQAPGPAGTEETGESRTAAL
mmetsp:Transcript_31017/g.88924  ORF Transcript_31017/g.88924 Transcript_31017/m.88924 type:complete len:567 (+) Transcript_31017:89-1789(+)